MALKNDSSCPLPEAGKNNTDPKSGVRNNSTSGYLFISFSNPYELIILLKSIVFKVCEYFRKDSGSVDMVLHGKATDTKIILTLLTVMGASNDR
jgi:hypothetical protein